MAIDISEGSNLILFFLSILGILLTGLGHAFFTTSYLLKHKKSIGTTPESYNSYQRRSRTAWREALFNVRLKDDKFTFICGWMTKIGIFILVVCITLLLKKI